MSFRASTAASWPMVQVFSHTTLVFRANTDVGLVFVVGTMTSDSTSFQTITSTPLPRAFRPLEQVSLRDVSGSVWMFVNPDGSVTTNPGALGSYGFRTFYFSSVRPG